GGCNAQNGQCSNPNAPNGTVCDDGNGCTVSDTCQAGSCTAGAPRVCEAQDTCHSAGTCDPQSGQCSNPVLPDGTTCDDDNMCTQTDSCAAGTCVGSNPVICVAS